MNYSFSVRWYTMRLAPLGSPCTRNVILPRQTYLYVTHCTQCLINSAMVTKLFFGVTYVLTDGITQVHIKCLASTYTQLKDIRCSRYIIVSIQTLLHTLVISVCDYNTLCTQIPYDKCIHFDRELQFKYVKDTSTT